MSAPGCDQSIVANVTWQRLALFGRQAMSVVRTLMGEQRTWQGSDRRVPRKGAVCGAVSNDQYTPSSRSQGRVSPIAKPAMACTT